MKEKKPSGVPGSGRAMLLGLPTSPKSKVLTIVPASRVLYIESKGDHVCTLVAKAGMNSEDFIKSDLNKDIGYFSVLLNSNLFFQVHKSYMVNIDFVAAYNVKEGVITMADKKTFTVAFRRRKQFKDFIHL